MTATTNRVRPGAILAMVALVCTSAIVLTNQVTHSRIKQMQHQVIQDQLQAVLPPHIYDNDLAADSIKLQNTRLGSDEPQRIWRARLAGVPVAAVLTAIAPDGYGGPITLLIAVASNGELHGVRVISHRETPGLGDEIELRKSDWIRGYERHSLVSLSTEQWRVKKDQGHFEHFTGATITPRAITAAVHSTLLFFKENSEIIFAATE